jgi:hypothetical protein
MMEVFANGYLSLKTVIEHRVAFEFRVGNLEGNLLVGSQVGRTVNTGHAGANYKSFDSEVFEVLTRLKLLQKHFLSPSHDRKRVVSRGQDIDLPLKKA